MSKLKAGRVIFRRIRGKIIPILRKEQGTIVATAAIGGSATLFGGTIGYSTRTKTSMKRQKKFLKAMGKGQKVDTKSLVKKSGLPAAVFTSEKDINRSKFLSNREKRFFKYMGHASGAFKAKNAFVTKIRGKNILVAAPKAQKSVIGHELGHLKDYKKHGVPGFFSHGVIGTLRGKTLAREKRAWKYSPVKVKTKEQKSIKRLALKGYENQQERTRIGAGVGAALGVGYSLLLRKLAGI